MDGYHSRWDIGGRIGAGVVLHGPWDDRFWGVQRRSARAGTRARGTGFGWNGMAARSGGQSPDPETRAGLRPAAEAKDAESKRTAPMAPNSQGAGQDFDCGRRARRGSEPPTGNTARSCSNCSRVGPALYPKQGRPGR